MLLSVFFYCAVKVPTNIEIYVLDQNVFWTDSGLRTLLKDFILFFHEMKVVRSPQHMCLEQNDITVCATIVCEIYNGTPTPVLRVWDLAALFYNFSLNFFSEVRCRLGNFLWCNDRLIFVDCRYSNIIQDMKFSLFFWSTVFTLYCTMKQKKIFKKKLLFTVVIQHKKLLKGLILKNFYVCKKFPCWKGNIRFEAMPSHRRTVEAHLYYKTRHLNHWK